MTYMPRMVRFSARRAPTTHTTGLQLAGGTIAVILCIAVLAFTAVHTVHFCRQGDPSVNIGNMVVAGCPAPTTFLAASALYPPRLPPELEWSAR